MNHDIEVSNTILMVYSVPVFLLLIAGIIVTVFGYAKEKKVLKLAGFVIVAIGFQLLLIELAIALYFNFIISLS